MTNGPEGASVHLGPPSDFKTELTATKILGVLALVIPKIPFKIKEFAYFGFGTTLVSASISHFARGDAHLALLFAFFIIDPIIFLAVLTVSYFYFQKSIDTSGFDQRSATLSRRLLRLTG